MESCRSYAFMDISHGLQSAIVEDFIKKFTIPFKLIIARTSELLLRHNFTIKYDHDEHNWVRKSESALYFLIFLNWRSALLLEDLCLLSRCVSYSSGFVSGCVSGQFCTIYGDVILNHLNQSCRWRQDCIFIWVVPCDLFEMSGTNCMRQGLNPLCWAALNLDKIIIRIRDSILY